MRDGPTLLILTLWPRTAERLSRPGVFGQPSERGPAEVLSDLNARWNGSQTEETLRVEELRLPVWRHEGLLSFMLTANCFNQNQTVFLNDPGVFAA